MLFKHPQILFWAHCKLTYNSCAQLDVIHTSTDDTDNLSSSNIYLIPPANTNRVLNHHKWISKQTLPIHSWVFLFACISIIVQLGVYLMAMGPKTNCCRPQNSLPSFVIPNLFTNYKPRVGVTMCLYESLLLVLVPTCTLVHKSS